MNAKEAYDYVAAMIQRKPTNDTLADLSQHQKDVETLAAGGWRLGIQAYRQITDKDKRGRPLATPRTHWRNIAYFFNIELKERIFYWNNNAGTRAVAKRLAEENPVPGGFDGFPTVTRDNNTGVVSSRAVSGEPPCPECDKLIAVKDKSQLIGEFLEWLSSEMNFCVCSFDRDVEAFRPLDWSTEKLLAMYFNINLGKVEEERRALLKYCREVNESSSTGKK